MVKTNVPFNPKKTPILYGGVSFTAAERRAINRVLDRNWWGIDKETALFEKELARYLGTQHAVFVNSGSSALLLAFAALDLPSGSEVIIPAVTFPTPIAALVYLGLTPVVVDVDPRNFNLDSAKIDAAITKKTRAIFVVHVAGNPADMESTMKVARKHGLFVIEDNCDGFGGEIAGKKLGTFGDISAISTHAAHVIATGEGGVVFTNRKTWYEKIVALRNWGRLNHLEGRNRTQYPELPTDYSRRYIYDQLGFNLKPLELQAAMGRTQLKRLSTFKRKRGLHYNKLYQIFKQFPDFFELPSTIRDADPCWYTFAFLVKNHSRERFTDFLAASNIEWRNILAGNIARQPAYRKRVKIPALLPHADEVLKRGLWISIHPLLTKNMFNYIESRLKTYIKIETTQKQL